MPWNGNECGKSYGNKNLEATIPSTDYDKNNRRMWNTQTGLVASKQMMQDVHVELNEGLPRQKQRSKSRRLLSPESGLRFKEENSKVLQLEQSFMLLWKLDTSESRSEISGKLWNVLLETYGHQSDRPCEKCNKKRKVNWTGHILRRNGLLRHVIGGKIEGKVEVAARRGRRRKQLLDNLKETRKYWKLT